MLSLMNEVDPCLLFPLCVLYESKTSFSNNNNLNQFLIKTQVVHNFLQKLSFHTVISFAHIQLKCHVTQFPCGLSFKVVKCFKCYKDIIKHCCGHKGGVATQFLQWSRNHIYSVPSRNELLILLLEIWVRSLGMLLERCQAPKIA